MVGNHPIFLKTRRINGVNSIENDILIIPSKTAIDFFN